MIPFMNLKAVFAALSTELGVTIIRADQPGDAPAYPYGTYKVTTEKIEDAHCNYITMTEGTDPRDTDKTYYEKTRMMTSLSFLDENRIDRISELANDALHWFKSTDGQATCRTNLITAVLVNNDIQDRTAYLETHFESKYGFDVQLEYTGTFVDTIESIETIKATPSPDNVDGAEIIFDVT